MEFVEVSAKTVDEAITKACIELEASSDRPGDSGDQRGKFRISGIRKQARGD